VGAGGGVGGGGVAVVWGGGYNPSLIVGSGCAEVEGVYGPPGEPGEQRSLIVDFPSFLEVQILGSKEFGVRVKVHECRNNSGRRAQTYGNDEKFDPGRK